MLVTDLVYIDTTGYHYSDYPTFLEWLQNEYKAIYGADIYIQPDSQDGQWIAILAQAFYDVAALGGSAYNSFSPLGAQGVGLSRVVKINGLRRVNPNYSTVDLQVVGTSGTVITNGIAQDTLNQLWNLPVSVTIPDAGTITVTATAQVIGAIQAVPNSVNTIFTPTRGWQTVNNSGAATAGVAVESDPVLRVRQSQSTANPSLTVFDGTIGGVANLDGVTAVKGYENDTNSTDANGIAAHTIEVVVEGGDATEICQEIALHKTPGTGTAGSTFETVYDSHGMPLVIHFQRPTPVTITCTVTIAANSAYSSDYEDLIKQSIADYINSIGIGGIGGQVLITRFYGPAYLSGTIPGQSYDVVSLEIGKNSDPQSTINIPVDFKSLPTCDVDVDVTVVVT